MHTCSHTARMGEKLGGLLVTDGSVQLREVEEAYQQQDLPCLRREETVFQGDQRQGSRVTVQAHRARMSAGERQRHLSGRRIIERQITRAGRLITEEGDKQTTGSKGSSCGFANDGANKWSPNGGHISQLGVCVHKGRRPRQDCDAIDWSRGIAHGKLCCVPW
jgi:hypothetical protein